MLDLGYICATLLLKSFHALEQAVKFERVLPCRQGDLLAMPESLSKSEEVSASNITYLHCKDFALSAAPGMGHGSRSASGM